MNGPVWYVILGVLLLVMALTSAVVKRLPVSTSLLYLGAGVILGRAGLGFLDASSHAGVIERVTELGVIVSLFTAGLKLRPHGAGRSWAIPFRLASFSMIVTIAAVAFIGVALLNLPLGAAVLLGAVLAPTDPVLASDVQVQKAGDEDPVRHSLTGEAGLNDGTAFPFVMLGLGLLGFHELGAAGWRWWAVDVVWAIAGGLAIGHLLGHLVGRLVLYLRLRHKEALGQDEFLTLGLIALAYGLAIVCKTYGFLAVFAAGLALRRFESRSRSPATQQAPREVRAITHGEGTGQSEHDAATHPERAPAYMADATLAFNEKLERILELGVMLMVGVLLATTPVSWPQLWLIGLILFVVRPAVVWLALLRSKSTRTERSLMAWFGIRGVGSLYYLFFAATHGLSAPLIEQLSGLVLWVVAASVVLHGVSVTPLMKWYARKTTSRAGV